MSSILEMKHIDFSYEREKVLKNVNLLLNQKDFIVIIGPNGGGKTTLIKLIIGLLKPTNGQILYPNQDIFDKKSLIGYVPQDTSLNADFPIRVFDVVLMGFLRQKAFGFRPNNTHKKEALEALQKLGVAHLVDRQMNELSGGQRQRVLIARALCGEPKLLVLDEPTSNIDKATQHEIYQILQKINKLHTIIIIDHSISVSLDYANRVLFVDKEIIEHNIASLKHDSIAHLVGVYKNLDS